MTAPTASKAPPSTASEAPAKPTEGAKAARKTAKATPVEGEKKRKKLRKKFRKETYSYHICKGKSCSIESDASDRCCTSSPTSTSRSFYQLQSLDRP
jgi:hypothetical protein